MKPNQQINDYGFFSVGFALLHLGCARESDMKRGLGLECLGCVVCPSVKLMYFPGSYSNVCVCVCGMEMELGKKEEKT